MKSLILFAFTSIMTGQAQFGASLPVSDTCQLTFSGATAVFDREHDRDTVGGGSLYCRLAVTASQANQAISDFKSAVDTPVKQRIGAILTFPVKVQDSHPISGGKVKDSTVLLNTRMEWAKFVQQKFTKTNLRQSEGLNCLTCRSLILGTGARVLSWATDWSSSAHVMQSGFPSRI